MGRWAAALRIARRDALRNKGRTALTVALVALPIAAVTFISGLLATANLTPEEQILRALGDSAQARIWAPSQYVPEELRQDSIGFQTSHGEISSEPVDPAAIERILPGRVAPALHSMLDAESDTALIPSLIFYQIDAQKVSGLLGQTDGAAAPGEGQAVLQAPVARRLGVEVGDPITLTLNGTSFEVTVVGTARSNNTFAQGLIGPGTLPFAAAESLEAADQKKWFVTGDAPVTPPQIEALNAVGFVVQSRQLATNPIDIYDDAFVDPAPDLATAGFLLAVMALGLLEATLLVGPAFAVGAKRNTRSLALVAACGGSPRDLRRIVLAGGAFAGILAGIAGIIIGGTAHLIWYAIASRSIYPPGNLVIPTLWPLASAGFALILGLLAAWIPARLASRTDVVAALAGRRADMAANRSFPWFGIIIGTAGIIAALTATAIRSPLLMAAGGVATLLGAVISSSIFIQLAGGFANRMKFPARFALRDAARHRTRSAPALAAVLAAVAVATGGLIATATEDRARTESWAPLAADGTGVISAHQVNDFAAIAPELAEQVRSVAPNATLAQVQQLRSVDDLDAWQIYPQNAASPSCTDCDEPASMISGLAWGGMGVLVDNGKMVEQTGLDGAREAAQALAEGKVLVNSGLSIGDDGTARLIIENSVGESLGDDLIVGAHLVPWRNQEYSLVLPLDLAETLVESSKLDDSGTRFTLDPVGALLTGTEINQETQDLLGKLLSGIDRNLSLEVEGRINLGGSDSVVTGLIVGATLTVALLATLLSIGLALADSRADLATVSAVGAAPRTRRRIVAAQAGVISVLGTACGITAGIMLGYVLANWQSISYGSTWTLVVPWQPIVAISLGIPALALGIGWLITPRNLPLRARSAE